MSIQSEVMRHVFHPSVRRTSAVKPKENNSVKRYQAKVGPHFRRENVRGTHLLPMVLNKVFSSRVLSSLGRGRDSMSLQDDPDSGVAKIDLDRWKESPSLATKLRQSPTQNPILRDKMLVAEQQFRVP